MVEEISIFAMAMDPVHVGTGGYSIGMVDNTIVRDPITNVPKIPGSTLAGTWRYYVTLELQSHFKEEYKADLKKREEHQDDISKLFNNPKDWMKNFNGNRFAKIKCAGQDEEPQKTLEESKNTDTGHCGHCIVCKGFGFSKKNMRWQGMIFFSDLQILFFPVFTIKGTKWITTASKLKETGIAPEIEDKQSEDKIKTETGDEKYLNLGWLYLEVEGPHNIDKNKFKIPKFGKFNLKPEDVIVVPESLFAHIVNSNLEVRTSVAIDPITGAAKEGALFTSEAIPRGTILHGTIRIFNKKAFEGKKNDESNSETLPETKYLIEALKESRHFYETLGIGGMTTRGFGRLIINSNEFEGGESSGNRK
ncbi:RAMP superfamily CRISPR-associated protein [Desulfurobacterium sp. TC5-1]|uniref:RAMP superfamily CRISPR-associated protein n=1 Tax=Desulfurobacterium sp. TC5-1 TaxID=1158318 RepID=UPI0012DDB2C3|nr:RAMP superfamily CRISPR-associated protein [Desulfurobacterium sp. TC5-1]